MSYKVRKVASLAFETSGIATDSNNKADGHQILSGGLTIADADTFSVIDSVYFEVKPTNQTLANWDKKLESIHGFKPEYLLANGILEEHAAAIMCDLLMEHFSDDPVVMLGHNVGMFSYWFLYNILNKYNYYRDCNIFISSRMMDTFPLGKVLYDLDTQEDIFKFLKLPLDNLNAEDKSNAYLQFYRICKKHWNALNEAYYNE